MSSKIYYSTCSKRYVIRIRNKKINETIKNFNDQNHTHQAQNPIEIDVSNFYSNSAINVKIAELVD
jgi:hypothetical protein